VYVRMKTMKLVSRSLLSHPIVLARLLPTRPSLATNTRYSRTSTVSLTLNHRQHHNYSQLPAQDSAMSGPPPKRKWPRGRGGGGRGGGDRTNGANPNMGPAAPSPAMGQQPKRPRVESTQPMAEGTVDVKAMYSTSAGDAAPKPFSELKGKLHQGLLDGLDKMGFE
jgi:hypothetical protein